MYKNQNEAKTSATLTEIAQAIVVNPNAILPDLYAEQARYTLRRAGEVACDRELPDWNHHATPSQDRTVIAKQLMDDNTINDSALAAIRLFFLKQVALANPSDSPMPAYFAIRY